MNITIIGAGKSGIAAVKLAASQGHNVFLTESKDASFYPNEIELLDKLNINYEFGKNSEKALENSELIISSPGVPPKSWIIQEAEARQIPIVSELEYASQFIENPIIAITGTNGKTTTTSLITHIFNNSGRKAVSAGNIGTPLCDLVNKLSKDTVIVAEVSSFQLDRVKTFRPEVALILNLSPDHLYYHGDMESYSQAKFKISLNQNEKNLLILNGDDLATLEAEKISKAQIAKFSINPVERGIYIEDGLIKFKEMHKVEELMPVSELSLPGIHNAYNSMAAALAARAFEIRNENIRDSLMSFSGVEHRLEYVRSINGIDFVNDSKATNINATWFALSSFSKPLVWIAGGRGDSNEYSLLDGLVDKHVKSIIAIGEESDAIFNHFCLMKRCIKASDMNEAVREAYKEAEAGDIVLFTPACKSFDMFMNFEHRGEVFKQIVNEL